MSDSVKGFSCTDDEVHLQKLGYSIGTTIGKGTLKYFKVKDAYSEKLHRWVAVKIVDLLQIPQVCREKFLPRELKILKRVSHPNCIKLFEILETEQKIYIVMELAPHGDLLEYIKVKGALPEPEARFMFEQLVQAVHYLHTNNISHRGLKLESLLLDSDRNIKVSNFVFARYYTDPPPSTLSETFCGSAAYAAPEVMQGTAYFPPLHDIWAMGVILYIMVCGNMPYDDTNVKKMIKAQLEGPVSFDRAISPEVGDLIYRILEVDVHRRYKLAQILAHPWITGLSEQPNVLENPNDELAQEFYPLELEQPGPSTEPGPRDSPTHLRFTSPPRQPDPSSDSDAE